MAAMFSSRRRTASSNEVPQLKNNGSTHSLPITAPSPTFPTLSGSATSNAKVIYALGIPTNGLGQAELENFGGSGQMPSGSKKVGMDRLMRPGLARKDSGASLREFDYERKGSGSLTAMDAYVNGGGSGSLRSLLGRASMDSKRSDMEPSTIRGNSLDDDNWSVGGGGHGIARRDSRYFESTIRPIPPTPPQPISAPPIVRAFAPSPTLPELPRLGTNGQVRPGPLPLTSSPDETSFGDVSTPVMSTSSAIRRGEHQSGTTARPHGSTSAWSVTTLGSGPVAGPSIPHRARGLAEDSEPEALEEIVPWLYQEGGEGDDRLADGHRSISPRTRQNTFSGPSTSTQRGGLSRTGKSSGTLRSERDGLASENPPPKRRGGIFGLLKGKGSSRDIHDAYRSDVDDDGRRSKAHSRGGASGFDSDRKQRLRKLGGKGKDKEHSSFAPLSTVLGGEEISLDTNLDEMDGIVNMEHFQQGRNGSVGTISVGTLPMPGPTGHRFGSISSASDQTEFLYPVDLIPGTAAALEGFSFPPQVSPTSIVPGGSGKSSTPTSPLSTRRRPSAAPSVPQSIGDDMDLSPTSGHLSTNVPPHRQGSTADGLWQGQHYAIGTSSTASLPSGKGNHRKDSNFSLSSSSSRRQLRKGSTTSGLGTSSVSFSGTTLTPSAAWTAPESWAVKGEELAEDLDADDEDEDDLDEARGSPVTGVKGLGVNGAMDAPRRSSLVPSMSSANGRPSVGSGTLAKSPVPGGQPQKNHCIRIFRSDATFSTIQCSLNISTADLMAQLARKYPAQTTGSYNIYLREKGQERPMGPQEKPLRLQRRRLEQAGYTEADRFEEIGQQDHSYLCRFIFKPENAPVSNYDEENADSFEFVDLSARSMETIPIFLYKKASGVVSLNLSKNAKLDLPADFVQLCSSLRELRLSHMNLKRVPQSVLRIPTLTRLDLSNNRIVELDHVALDALQELTTLKVHNNRLYDLPDHFARLESLKFLNISNNKFEVLPKVVTEISSLMELDVSFNMISSLPPEVGKLRNLERFVILGNSIATLPSTFGQLEALKELDCRRNLLSDFSVLSELKRIEVIRCEHNSATALDGTFEHLRMVHASHNSVTRLQLAGTKITLTTLNLTNAKLASMGETAFAELLAVETLVLDNNQITTLHDSFGQLKNLKHFSCRNNRLDSIPPTISRLKKLQFFDVSNNNLAVLPEAIWLCPQLVSLNASSNLLHDFPQPISSGLTDSAPPEEADRKASTASKAPSTASGRAPLPLISSLEKLYLADNKLSDEAFDPICILQELKILNLSFNVIFEIPPGRLEKLLRLEELYLSGNQISGLPTDDFEKITNVRILHINGNKLHTLPAEIGKMTKLQVVDVGNNYLKYNVTNWTYDWNWNFNPELRYLNLSGNSRLEIKSPHEESPVVTKRNNYAGFNNLRKLRLLGLMDVTIMPGTPVPDESQSRRIRSSLSFINTMGYGVADAIGRGEHLNMVDVVMPKFRSKDDEALFGLFDARTKVPNGGGRILSYLQDTFPDSFAVELAKLRDGETVQDALRRTFLFVNREYGNRLLPLFDSRRKDSDVVFSGERFGGVSSGKGDVRSGASAIIVYIRDKMMYVANAGNALAVVSGRGGSARLVSTKHDPYDPLEIARIRAAEGWVSQKGLVNDEVEVSRSFGYYHVIPAINVRPDVQAVELTDTDEFIIVANQGLWNYMTCQAAVDVARSARGDPMVAAQKLRDLAISYGSDSSIMVMVVVVSDLFRAKDVYLGPNDEYYYDGDPSYGTNRAFVSRRTQAANAAGERYLNLLDNEVAPPTGMVALVFTDIRNSTALWETNPGMQTAIRMHNQLLRRQLRAIGGYEVKTEGDAFMVSFPTVASALLWCFTVQRELLREDWPQEILECDDGKEITSSKGELVYRGLSVRMGIHWGNPVCEKDPNTWRMDYFGPMVNRSARITAVAEGGQITASADVVALIKAQCFGELAGGVFNDDVGGNEDSYLDSNERRDVVALRKMGFGITEIGERRLKGLETPEFLFLLYPTQLAGRLKVLPGGAPAANGLNATTEVLEPVPQILDYAQIRHLGTICLRLEAVSAANLDSGSPNPNGSSPVIHSHSPVIGSGATTVNAKALASRRKARVHPHLLAYPIRADATDDELAAILEALVIRVENVLSTLVLRQMGPFTEVLSQLNEATKIDPRYILQALLLFGKMDLG